MKYMDEIYMLMNMLLAEKDNYVFISAVETVLAFLIIINDKITHNVMERTFCFVVFVILFSHQSLFVIHSGIKLPLLDSRT